MRREKRHRSLTRAARAGTDHAPAGGDAPTCEIRAEAAVLLADLAWNDPETVCVVRCAREIEYGGTLGDYVIEAGELRTLARPGAQVSLMVAAGVSCRETLLRLDHIRAYLAELPPGSILATDESGTDAATNRLARLRAAHEIVLAEMR
jgi:hypothetical protein